MKFENKKSKVDTKKKKKENLNCKNEQVCCENLTAEKGGEGALTKQKFRNKYS